MSVRVLANGDLGIRARNDVAQPLVAVILFVVVNRCRLIRRRVETAAALFPAALTDKPAVLATPTEQLAKCATRSRVDIQHAPDR